MKLKTSFFLCLFIPLSCFSQLNLRHEVLELLPKEIRKIDKSLTSLEIKDIFKNKILSADQKTIHVHYFGQSNDVSVGLENDKFKYLYVELPKGQGQSSLYQKVMDQLNDSQKKKVIKDSTKRGHETGREIVVELPEYAMRLYFKNSPDRELKSLVLWTPGAKAP